MIVDLVRRFARSRLKGRPALLATVLAAALALAPAPQAAAEPALWRVSDEDNTIWFFGSIHVLRPGTEWRTAALGAAFEDAEIVYFEAPTDVFAQMRLIPIIAQLGMLPPDRRLGDLLSPAGAERYARVLSDLGAARAEIDAMRPWLAFLTLSVLVFVDDGADPNAGVDVLLNLDALRASKEIRHFETLEQQTRIFAEMPEAQQLEMLEEALAQIDAGLFDFDDLESAWLTGDLASLSGQITEASEGMPAALYDALFTQRNIAWAEEIDRVLDGSEDALIVAGAGHFIGANNVLELLAARGHVATRVTSGE